MSTFSAGTRPLVAVVGSSADRSAQRITVTMEDRGGQKLDLVIEAGAVGALTATAAARLAEVTEGLPPEQRPMAQSFEVQALQWAANEDGQIARLFEVQGAGTVPLLIPEHVVSTLQTELAEAAQYLRGKAN
jgi:hypothetical protein